MPTERFPLAPIYLALDVSKGVKPYSDPLETIVEAVLSPPVCELFQIGLLCFARSAKVVTPLANIEDLGMPEAFKGEKSIDFESIFDLIRSTVEKDIKRLRATKVVCRPIVFLVISQCPKLQDWRPAYVGLVGQQWSPEIVVVDIGQCPAETLKYIATRAAYRASDSSAVGLLIRDYMDDAFRSRRATDLGFRLATHLQGMQLLWSA